MSRTEQPTIWHPSVGPVRSRIALVGRSGTGKSSLRAELAHTLSSAPRSPSVSVLRLAAPLYRLQALTYAEAGQPLDADAQDQELLTFLAGKLRRIDPDSLIRPFLVAVAAAGPDAIVINDDLRDPTVDAPALRRSGFFLVRVHCAEELRRRRLAARADLTSVDDGHLNAELEKVRCDTAVDTGSGQPAELALRLLDALRVGGGTSAG